MPMSLWKRTTKQVLTATSDYAWPRGVAASFRCRSGASHSPRTDVSLLSQKSWLVSHLLLDRNTWPHLLAPLFQAPSERQARGGTRRYLQTENSFQNVADQTLESIQDALDDLFDKQTLIDYEVSMSSGVLTLKLPPHGTWVINKQMPNRQLWWSSPLSGPQRFEYNDTDNLWYSTKSEMNLGQSLALEIHNIFPELDPLKLSV